MANHLYHQTAYISVYKRYQLLHEYASCFGRNDTNIIQLLGNEKLILHKPIALSTCGLMAAFQLHLKVPLSQSVRYYNIIQSISAPMLALCANSAYFNGQDIWSETRIGLFELMVNMIQPSSQVDLFGDAYLGSRAK